MFCGPRFTATNRQIALTKKDGKPARKARRNGDAVDASGGGRGAGGGDPAGWARGGAVAAKHAGLRVEADPVRAVHERDGHAAGHLLRAAQGRRQERPDLPLQALRRAGDLQGLPHQHHRRPPPLQAMRPQRHHQQLPRQFSSKVSSRWQQCWSSHYLSWFPRVDGPVISSVVSIGLIIQHSRYVFLIQQ